MKRCPITYLPVEEGSYSTEGLHILSPHLKHLHDFPYKEHEQYELMLEFADKLSFSGVQPKLSAKLNIQQQLFEIVKKGGTFLLKLPRINFPELPQNEALTMRLAQIASITVPKHGMIYAIDGSLLYFVERFDRVPKRQIHVEDFGQLANLPREKKYDSSMEKIVYLIEEFCTFPILEKEKLFRLSLFNFLVGNEDMHLKNFSLLTENGITALSPAYDLINSTIMLKTKEEIALPLNGKKSNLKRSDWIQYFGIERLRLEMSIIEKILHELQASLTPWKTLLHSSFLSDSKKESYSTLLDARANRLF